MWSFPRYHNDLRSLALLLICGLFLFSPLLDGGTTHLAAMIIRLLVLTILGIYCVRVIKTRAVVCPRLSVELPVVLFLALSGASILWSPYRNQSLQWMLVLLCYAALLYLLAAFVEQWEDVATFRKVLVGLALAQAMWAFVQVFRGATPRPSGTFFNPNFLAGYLAAVSVVLLAYVSYGMRWRPRCWATWPAVIESTLPLVILSILVGALLLTGSRGGALALVMGAALVIGSRFGRRGLIAVVLIVALVALIHNPIRDRVVAEHLYNPAAYTRWEMWRGAMNEIIKHPAGIGLGLYQYAYPRYAIPVEEGIVRYGKIAYTPHNEYLQVGIELGLAGLAIFLLGIVLAARDARLLLRQRLSREERGLAVGMCGAIVVILTQAAVDSNLHEPALAILLVACVGIVSLGPGLSRKQVQRSWSVAVKRPTMWATAGFAVIILLAVHVIQLGFGYQSYQEGTRLLKEQQIEDAIGNFQRAVALDPGKSLYHNSLAGAYFQLYWRSHDQAMVQASIEELRTAIALNPLDGRLQSLLGFVSSSQASRHPKEALDDNERLWLERAVEAYSRAAELEPFFYSHRLELGQLMLMLGRRDAAEQYFKKVLELEPNYLPARETLAHLYAESGRGEAANEEFQQIVARQKHFHARPSNPLEQSFLQVDVSRLQLVISGKVSPT